MAAGAAGVGRSGGTVTDVQAVTSTAAPRIAAAPSKKRRAVPSSALGAPSTENDQPMSLILFEALVALLLLVFIVWWTMFSGRKGGERRDERDDRAGTDQP